MDTGLTSGIASIGYGGVALDSSSAAKAFTVLKTGGEARTITCVSGVTGSTTFTVTFTPVAGGSRTTTLRILNNDGDEGTFDIALTGTGLSFTNDTDGDGLNDASEFNMAPLGFDWEVSQPSLVAALPGLLNPAGFYTTAQVQALNLPTPLIQRNPAGDFTLTIGVEKSTTLLPGSFNPFPMNTPGFTTTISGAGKLEFQFTAPDNAAFFRL